MIQILLNSIALEPNRWTRDKIAHFSLEQLLPPIADAGFHLVELWGYHISRRPGNEIRSIRSLAQSLDLQFPVIGIYPRLHLSGQDRQTELEDIERLLNYSRQLGAEIVKMWVGIYGTQQISDADYRNTIDCMHEILDLADSLNLAITAETHPNTLCDSLEASQQIQRVVGGEKLKFCFQPFDFFDTEKAVDDYNAFAGDVIHVQYRGQKNGRMELLEKSDIDYGQLTHELVSSGFDGKICIEFVKDCVVDKPEDLDIEQVLANAVCDRYFIANTLRSLGVVDYAI